MVVGGERQPSVRQLNIAGRWPAKIVDLYFPHERPLLGHHPGHGEHLQRRLIRLGVGVHPGHRAVVPKGFACDAITADPVQWSTGQAPATADAIVWAIGKVRPNTDWLPDEVLDEDRFVSVTEELRVPGHRGVFAVGDVAATDPLRSSARNRADAVLAHNVRAEPLGRRLRPTGRGAAVGFGDRCPAGWLGGFRPQRPPGPHSGRCGRRAGDAVDCSPRHVSRRAHQPSAGVTASADDGEVDGGSGFNGAAAPQSVDAADPTHGQRLVRSASAPVDLDAVALGL